MHKSKAVAILEPTLSMPSNTTSTNSDFADNVYLIASHELVRQTPLIALKLVLVTFLSVNKSLSAMFSVFGGGS